MKRLNMLKSIKGHNWGASTKLLLTTYKVLVRSLIEYAPLAILKMAPKYQERLERAAVRIATHWPPGVSTEIYGQLQLERLKDRALKLMDKYLCKGYRTNKLVTDLIDDYNEAAPIIEGLFRRPKNKPVKSILGAIKEAETLNCHQLFGQSQQPMQ
jgi:hypothetical protein